MTTYLRKGVEKTTSVLEQVNQRMKKNTKNNRGGHYETTMQDFANIYQFFWNTEPLQLSSESKTSKKSPFARLSESISKDELTDLTGQWWSWLQPMSYHEYRKQVQIKIKQHKSESIASLDAKKQMQNNLSINYSEKAKRRWQNSKTLQSLKNLKNIKPEKIKSVKTSADTLKKQYPFDQDLYHFLLRFPDGVERSFLVKYFKLPRTTIYDSLVRLQNVKLIYRKTLLISKRGRPPVYYFAVPLPNG